MGLTPRSRNTLRKAVPSSQSEGGMHTWAVRTAGPGSVVPTDHIMEAVSRVQDGSVGSTPPLKFRTSVHRECGQATKGQTPADIWWPASQAAEPHTHPSPGKSQREDQCLAVERYISFSEFLHYFMRIRFLHLSEGVSGTSRS